MTERARFRSLAWAAGLAALASCGCVAEWPWTVRPEGEAVAKGPPAPGAPAIPPAPLIPAQPPDPAVTQLAADLQQNLAATRDQLKEQLARVHQLEVQLQEKEQTIQAMNHEVKAAREEVARACEIVQRGKDERVAQQERIRRAEQENVTTLQTLATSLEHALETDKPPAPAAGDKGR